MKVPIGDCGILPTFLSFFQMSKPRKFMNIDMAVEFLETMEDEIPTNCQHETVNIIELPPKTVDEMSDAEEFDDEEIGETQIVDVPGNVEVYVGTDDESEDVCEDQASLRKSKHAKIVLKEIPKWKKSAPKPTVPTIDNYNNKPVMEELIPEFIDKNPFELFMLIMSGIFEIIQHQSQIYAAQKNDPSFHCTIEDYMVFVGILLLSGHRPYPRQELYWSLHPNFDCPIIREAMSKNRFMALKKYFHLNNNLEIPENCKDRCFKIRPLIEKMNKNFLQFGYFSDKYSVDEKIVGYYGRHPIKQFVRGKPVRFGFKEWALCSTSGYTYKFFVYQGANAQPRPKDVLLGTEVVLNLLEKVPSGVSVFFDNFFTNMDLMKSLTELGIKASGTVRLNRLPGNPFGAKKDLMKKEKGFLKTALDAISGLFACTWKDNSIVNVLSNVDGVNPMKLANRRGQPVQVPKCITEYNAGMLGVDLADWKTQKYRVGIE